MSFWYKRTVLVTGATGFIGSHLVERLAVEGACARVLVRDPQKLLPALRDPGRGALAPIPSRSPGEAAR